MRHPVALLVLSLATAAATAGCSARPGDQLVLSGRVTDESVTLSAPSLGASKPPTATAFLRVGGASRLESAPVEVGDRVKAGEVVAIFDRSALSAQLDSARAASRVAASRTGVLDARIEDIDAGRSTIEDNRGQISESIAELTSMRSELVAQLAQVTQQLEQLRALQDRLKRIPAPGTLPTTAAPPQPPVALPDPSQVAANIAALEAGAARIEAGITRIDAGLRQARAGLAQLESADARAADARKTLEGLKDVAGVAADVSAVAVQLAQARLEEAVLRSPADGVVISARQTGEAVVPAAPLIVLRPDAPSAVNVYLTPRQHESVGLGDIATVHVDSMRAAGFSARVTFIAVRSQYPPSWLTTSETHMTRAFLVRVTLDDATVRLPAGTPADVELSLDGSDRSGRDDEGN